MGAFELPNHSPNLVERPHPAERPLSSARPRPPKTVGRDTPSLDPEHRTRRPSVWHSQHTRTSRTSPRLVGEQRAIFSSWSRPCVVCWSNFGSREPLRKQRCASRRAQGWRSAGVPGVRRQHPDRGGRHLAATPGAAAGTANLARASESTGQPPKFVLVEPDATGPASCPEAAGKRAMLRSVWNGLSP